MRDAIGSDRTTGEYVSLVEFLDFLHRWRVMIGITVLTITSLVTCHLATRPATFNASATLLLEDGKESGGLLSDLATLTSAPAAEKEMAILRLRSLAEEIVRDPSDWTPQAVVFEPAPADDSRAERAINLGLTTRSWPEDLSPFGSLIERLFGGGGSPHRLFASFDASSPETVGDLSISFPEPDLVRIGVPRFLGFGDRDAVEFPYEPGTVVEYETVRLGLAATGDYVGKSYRVSRVPFRSAVEDLMGRIEVRETARNSGVLLLTVEDSEPNRAADIANAVVRCYITRSVEIGSRRATKTMTFLESELERVTRLLRQAELDVVELSARNPHAINVEASSRVTIERLAGYESDKMGLRLARVVLEEAESHIVNGEYEALARLSKDLPDVLTLGYVEAIGELSTDALQLERSDTGPYKHLLQEKVEDLRRGRERAAFEAVSLRGVLEAVDSGDEHALPRLAGASTAGLDSASESYIAEIARLDSELAGVAQVVTEKHPEYVAMDAARGAVLKRAADHLSSRIRGVELHAEEQATLAEAWQRRIDEWPAAEREQIAAAIQDLTKRISRNIASQSDAIGSRLSVLDEAILSLEGELSSLPESQRILAESMRRREAYAEIARVLMDGLQQAQLSRAATLPSAVLVDPALPSSHPAGPSILVTISLTALLSFLLGLGLAWLRCSFSDSVRTQAEVEDVTGLPVVGAVPDFRRGRLRRTNPTAGLAHVRDDPNGPEAEVYRSIRESLRFALDPDQRLNTMAVVSSVPHEGKTITNVNLALSLAGSEERVLLVDADLRKPSVSSYFDLAAGPGLRDVLEGADWRAAVQPSKFEGLDILPAGKARGSASDLLRGGHVRTLVQELAADYDRVVFDLPPLFAVADVETFADQLDGVLLLVRAELVPRRIVATSVGRLRRAGVRLVGAVLNAVRAHGNRYAYYSYGSYGERGGTSLDRTAS